ncbi:MAG: hypothetical protein JNL54_03425 [Kineosporiaceae bacterium]|nr:hypothetical protein [Kineosporiaceae bacterium]
MLTGNVWWLAIPFGAIGVVRLAVHLVGWAGVAFAVLGTAALMGGLLTLAHRLGRRRAAQVSARTAPDHVEVLAWVEHQAQGNVWPSEARARAVEAEQLPALEVEAVPVLEAPLSQVLTAGERAAVAAATGRRS